MIEDPASTGLTALLFALVLGLFEVVKRLLPGAKNGPQRHSGTTIVECPNKIHTLNATLEKLEKRSGPIDGVEQWKRSQMQDVLLQKIIDQGSESVTLQQKSLLVLEKIARRPPRKEDETNAKRGKLERFADDPSSR